MNELGGMFYPHPHELNDDVEYFASFKRDQRVYCIEECSELIKACTKSMRGRDNRSDIIEEIAHVHLTMNHLCRQMDISIIEIQAAMDKKIIDYKENGGGRP